MSVHYYFYNNTCNKPNIKLISGFGECTFVAKLDSMNEIEIVNIFQSVISENNWNEEDEISAKSDEYGHYVIEYHKGKIEFRDDDLIPINIEKIEVSKILPLLLSDDSSDDEWFQIWNEERIIILDDNYYF